MPPKKSKWHKGGKLKPKKKRQHPTNSPTSSTGDDEESRKRLREAGSGGSSPLSAEASPAKALRLDYVQSDGSVLRRQLETTETEAVGDATEVEADDVEDVDNVGEVDDIEELDSDADCLPPEDSRWALLTESPRGFCTARALDTPHSSRVEESLATIKHLDFFL